MAIRFMDVEPEKGEGGTSTPPRRAQAPVVQPASVEDMPPADADAEVPLPGLLHAKPEPKPRGRKKPLASAGPETPKGSGDAAPLLEGLLPELQAHAKPTPKPRGRKKAFG